MKKITLFLFAFCISMLTFSQSHNWDNRFVSANSPDNIIYCQTVFNGHIVAGGQFTTVAGNTANYIALWDGTGWQVVGDGFNGKVLALEVYQNQIVAGGEFTQSGTTNINYLAYWDGSTWSELASGTNGDVHAIKALGSNLYVGGSFDTVGTATPANNIAYYQTSGGWTAMSTGTDSTVNAIDFFNDSVIIGGDFTIAGNDTVNYLAVFDASNNWNSIGTGADQPVYALHSVDSNSIYIGGAFTSIDNHISNNVILMEDTSWITFGSDINDTVFALTDDTGMVYIGGAFTQANGLSANHICSWNGVAFDTLSSGLNGNCYSLASYNHDIYAGGNFSQAGTNESDFFAIWGVLPFLQQQSSTQKLCMGDTLDLFCDYYSTTPISYQWYHNDTVISGETDSNLTIVASTLSDTGIYYCIATNLYGSDTSALNIIPPFHIDIIGLDSSYCSNSPSDTLTGIPAGGTFSGNGISENIFDPDSLSGLQPITYSYTDSNNCTNYITDTTQVNEVQPVVFYGLEQSYCESDEIHKLSPSTLGGVFSGNGIFDGNLFDPQNAIGYDTIVYTLTDTNNCTATATRITYVYTNPTIAFHGVDSVYCQGNPPDSIWATPDGGTYTGLTENYFYPDSIGTFTVTYSVDNGNCSVTDSIQITVYPSPTASFSGLDSVYCDNDSPALLTGTPSAGVFEGLGIVDSLFDPSQSDTGQINITYTYTNSDGCSATDTQITNVLPTQIVTFNLLDSAYCVNHDTVGLKGYPSGGAFSGNGIINDSIFDPQSAGTGTHDITYSWENDNGCYSRYTRTTEVVDTPNISVDDTVVVCYGNTGQLSVNNNDTSVALTYTWSTLDSSASISVSPTHDLTYTVTVTSGVCQVVESVFVPVYLKPILNLDDTYDICYKDTIYSGVNCSSYLWQPDNTTDSFYVAFNSGSLYLTVTDSNGCQSSDTTYVTIKSSPIVDIEDELTIAQGNPVVIGVGSGYGSYLWSTGDTTDYIVYYSDSLSVGDYTVWVTAQNGNGCWDSDTMVIHIIQGMGISDYENPFNLSVYPNPSNGNFNISLQNLNLQEVAISIIDLNGKIIYNETVSNSLKFKKNIILSEVKSSLYLLKIKIGKDVFVKKILIKK